MIITIKLNYQSEYSHWILISINVTYLPNEWFTPSSQENNTMEAIALITEAAGDVLQFLTHLLQQFLWITNKNDGCMTVEELTFWSLHHMLHSLAPTCLPTVSKHSLIIWQRVISDRQTFTLLVNNIICFVRHTLYYLHTSCRRLITTEKMRFVNIMLAFEVNEVQHLPALLK